MRNIFDLITPLSPPAPDEPPWLLLGKGPSLARRHDFDLTQYTLLGLNDVCLVEPVFLTHTTDIEAMRRCGYRLAANSRYLVLPWHPHFGHKPGEATVLHWTAHDLLLHTLVRAGRVYTYNSSRAAGMTMAPGPVVRVRQSSAVAAINLLATAGVREIYTLGIDGGSRYCEEFQDKSPLGANGLENFGAQFEEIERTRKQYRLKCEPLVPVEP